MSVSLKHHLPDMGHGACPVETGATRTMLCSLACEASKTIASQVRTVSASDYFTSQTSAFQFISLKKP